MNKPAPAGPSTLIDVAREAGVSPSTVSRILNGTARVSDDKRQAVLKAIARTNFAPNLMAQGLKKGKTNTIGIIVQDISSPFFDETLHGVDDGLKGTGYASVIVTGHWSALEEIDRIRLLLARKVDGIVLLSGSLADEDLLQFAAQRPIVVTGRALEGANVLGFTMDNEHGAWLAVRHLLDLGHRRIAFISGPPSHADATSRLRGYRRALEESNVAFDPALIVEGNFRENSGMVAINHLFDTGIPFTGVFAANDQCAYGARLALYRRGVRVPEDVSLVGFDDIPGSAYTTPPLTTVRQPLYDIGHTAITALLRLISGDRVPPRVPPVELVVRETTRQV